MGRHRLTTLAVPDFSGTCCAEIDWLVEMAPRPDLAAMPVNGCNIGNTEAVRLGVHYDFDKLCGYAAGYPRGKLQP